MFFEMSRGFFFLRNMISRLSLGAVFHSSRAIRGGFHRQIKVAQRPLYFSTTKNNNADGESAFAQAMRDQEGKKEFRFWIMQNVSNHLLHLKK